MPELVSLLGMFPIGMVFGQITAKQNKPTAYATAQTNETNGSPNKPDLTVEIIHLT
jgi:hypothetical protein